MRRTSSDHTLGEVIADYFRRINRGESPDAQAYIQRYPAWADELRKFFEQSACLDSFIREAGLRDDTHAPAADAAGECPPAGHEDTDDGDPSLPSVTGYRILEEVGAGGQGVVYKAEQLGTRRTVALKVIRDGAFATQAERRRFRSEAELAARLTHPNIVSVYASGQDRRHDYFAMQYVDGEPLDTYLATVSRSLDAVVTLFLEVCEAVAYAHRHGVLHRDLKPSNILVDASGTPHIVDFGLAKTVSDPASGPADYATRVGEFAGTWHYASPEQAKLDPAAVDVRSDVYTLGVILYEMLTHQLPYPVDNETREAVARHILETPPIRPSMLRREIDDDLETVMLTALQKDPDRRYQSAAALADDIKRCLADDAIAAKRDSTFYVLRKTLQRHRGRVAAATGCLAALIAFAVTIAVLYTRMRSARATTEAHMVLERLGQPHEMDKLSELNFYVSRLNEFTDTYPTSPLTRRVSAEAFDNAGALLADAIVDAPADIHLTARAPDNPDYDRAIAWLAANEPELADIERRARERRFTFGVVRQAGSDRADFVAAADLAPGATAVTVMIARAYRWSRMGDHGAATRSLQAARSIAVDIADGRLVTHKTRSIVLRAKIYDAIMSLLMQRGTRSRTDASPYVAFALQDPPLPSYWPALIAARHQVLQLCQEATEGTAWGTTGHVNLDALDAITGGYFSTHGLLTDEQRATAQAVPPNHVVQLIDRWFADMAQWDGLTFQHLTERARAMDTLRAQRGAWTVLGPLFPNLEPAYRTRGRINALRSATMLSAYLSRYRAEHGHWPGRLDDAVPPERRTHLLDPYTGHPFVYRRTDDGPLLYSVNEDGTDNAAAAGDWGATGTDVIFLQPAPRR